MSVYAVRKINIMTNKSRGKYPDVLFCTVNQSHLKQNKQISIY